jgi:hypothetical protein
VAHALARPLARTRAPGAPVRPGGLVTDTAMACQRWREGRDAYRPPDEPIRTLDYEVAPLEGNAEAKAFVVAHHYSRSYPAARRRFGLYRGGDLVGVAVFSVPCNGAVLRRAFPGVPDDATTELGRFVVLDDVPGNGETWFLARAFDLLRREGFAGVLSFSDPLPRAAADGRLVTPGHVGTIYQAFNGTYLGRSKAEPLLLLPDGSSLPRRSLSKIRAGDSRWRCGVSRLVAQGAPAPYCYDRAPDVRELREWLDEVLPALTRSVRHPGNHRYAWALDRRTRRVLPPRDPALYPKKAPAA